MGYAGQKRVEKLAKQDHELGLTRGRECKNYVEVCGSAWHLKTGTACRV